MKKTLLMQLLTALLFSSGVVFAQNKTIQGKVTDASGEALYGVNVTVKGTTNGTITNESGSYTLSAAASQTITFSYIGYATQNIVVGNQTTINVTLTEDANTLGEVVVTAFGIEKDKKSLAYSITQVDGDKFTESRATNLGTALTGKIAGVNVSSPTTGAAGSSRVVIRGGSSLGGNDQPLYVINGVPMDNSNQGSAGLWGGNDNGDGLTAINPDDIDNISVLKGNTASALYGARAANGVVLITTKSGKTTKGLGVQFTSNYTMDKAINRFDLQDTYGTGTLGQKPTTQEEALAVGNSSWGAKLDGSSVVQFDGVSRPYSSTGENINSFYKTGNTWSNTLALSGGNNVGNFRFSASNLMNEDIMPNASFDRTSLNANVNGKFGKLDLAFNGQYTKEGAKNRPRMSDTPGNGNYTIITKAPNISFADLMGDPNKLGANDAGTELQHQGNVYAQNPWWAAYQFLRLDDKNRVFGNVALTYHLTDWLYVKGRMGTDFNNGVFTTSEPYGTAYKTTGDFNKTFRNIREDNADLFVGANKTFGKIAVDALVGGNRMRRTNEDSRIGGNGLKIPFFSSVNNVASQTYSYGFSEYGINSIFGSANFGYDNFLFLNVTGRQDQFSTLSPESNSVFYPSVGMSFVFTDVINTLPSWLSTGKVRASWAQVGGGAPNPYSNNLTYSLQGYDHLGATLATISNGSIPNSALKPYLSTEFEVGLDIRFLQNRLGVDMAYYNRNTVDDILNTSISGTSGYGSTQINVGELSNKGIELLINATPLRSKDFNWNLSFNFARNISKAISLGTNAQGEPIEFLNLEEARSRQERIRHYIGEPLGIIAGYKQKEINGQPVYDADGYPVRGDFQILAQGRHPISAGLSNSFSYKNLSLSFLIDMRSGGSIMSGTNLGLYGVGLHKGTLEGRDGGLTVSGVNANGEAQTWNIPVEKVQTYYGQYAAITQNFVYDASFGKLREISLGYNIPSSLLKKTKLQSVRLSAVGRNVAILWSNVPNIDPESGYSAIGGAQGLEYFNAPSTRNLGFNLNASF